MGIDTVGLNTDTFVFTTDDLDDLLSNPCCDTCGSCGDLWCGCWGGCSVMQCKYGHDVYEAYERDRKFASLHYEMLMALGIDNAYSIDLERIKIIANSGAGHSTIYDHIAKLFDRLKDEELD